MDWSKKKCILSLYQICFNIWLKKYELYFCYVCTLACRMWSSATWSPANESLWLPMRTWMRMVWHRIPTLMKMIHNPNKNSTSLKNGWMNQLHHLNHLLSLLQLQLQPLQLRVLVTRNVQSVGWLVTVHESQLCIQQLLNLKVLCEQYVIICYLWYGCLLLE